MLLTPKHKNSAILFLYYAMHVRGGLIFINKTCHFLESKQKHFNNILKTVFYSYTKDTFYPIYLLCWFIFYRLLCILEKYTVISSFYTES